MHPAGASSSGGIVTARETPDVSTVSDPTGDPSPLYGAGARALQDELGTRRLADRLSGWTVHAELTADDITLIKAQSTVWIATVDPDGWPDVSYKGGDVGFIDVVSATELRIPSYDGNGMMRTMGNIADTGKVALLFIDTARPWRMRLHGEARIETGESFTSRHHGAQAVIVVTLRRIFPNCGRYIHQRGEISEYVPRPGTDPPVPEWKRYQGFRDVLPEADQRRLDAESS
jgi:predicted pyridoxine 5'-phosphate oxidase superfamily flavin-nucleotide-binding protein